MRYFDFLINDEVGNHYRYHDIEALNFSEAVQIVEKMHFAEHPKAKIYSYNCYEKGGK